jgi:hypothetical protein
MPRPLSLDLLLPEVVDGELHKPAELLVYRVYHGSPPVLELKVLALFTLYIAKGYSTK